jgi:hypothetical protein
MDLASQSATHTTRQTDCPERHDENSSGGKTSQPESDKDSTQSEEETEKPSRKRGGGRQTGLTDEDTKLQNVKIMHVMLQSKKMLGSLLGFGRKEGTEFYKMSTAYEELHACLQKHEDAHIKHLAVSAIRTLMNKCIKERTSLYKAYEEVKYGLWMSFGHVGGRLLANGGRSWHTTRFAGFVWYTISLTPLFF